MLSYLITCTCFVKMRELSIMPSYFSLHTIIKGKRFVTSMMRKMRCTQDVVPVCALAYFSLRERKGNLCVINPFRKKGDKMVRFSIFSVILFSFIFTTNACIELSSTLIVFAHCLTVITTILFLLRVRYLNT